MTPFLVKYNYSNVEILLGIYVPSEDKFYQEFKTKFIERMAFTPCDWNKAFEDFETDTTKYAKRTTLESRLVVSGLQCEGFSISLEKVGLL